MTSVRFKRKTPVVACLGEVLIDFIAKEIGTLNSVNSFSKFPGGAPANVAVGIARLGVDCGFIGKVGADIFGDFLISVLKQNNVDTCGIIQTTEARTALAFVGRSETGDREFLFYRNSCADLLLTESELPIDWLKEIQYLHVGGVSLTREPSRQATFHGVKVAKRNGAIISFDPNLRLDLWSNGVRECQLIVRSMLEHIDIFLPSQEELSILMAVDDIDKAIVRAHQLGPKIICVKMGSRGSLVSEKIREDEYRQFQQPSLDVNVVDTTGAGDGYDAGLIVGLAQGLSLEEAVLRGTAVASLVITKVGAMTALPTETELIRFLNEFHLIHD